MPVRQLHTGGPPVFNEDLFDLRIWDHLAVVGQDRSHHGIHQFLAAPKEVRISDLGAPGTRESWDALVEGRLEMDGWDSQGGEFAGGGHVIRHDAQEDRLQRRRLKEVVHQLPAAPIDVFLDRLESQQHPHFQPQSGKSMGGF